MRSLTGAFYGCSSLTSIEIPDNVTSIGSWAFYGCSSLTSIEIPDSVTSIGSWAFRACSDLTKVIIGNSVTSIVDNMFYECWSLTNVTIGNSVVSIGDYAFYKCYCLTSIVIPNGVTDIGVSAFESSSLWAVYYVGTATEWAEIKIGGNNSYLTSATRYYYSKEEPALNADNTAYDGNYWHYGENGEIVVWEYEN